MAEKKKWAKFKCGHMDWFPVDVHSRLDWEDAECPKCGQTGIQEMDGPDGLKELFSF